MRYFVQEWVGKGRLQSVGYVHGCDERTDYLHDSTTQLYVDGAMHQQEVVAVISSAEPSSNALL